MPLSKRDRARAQELRELAARLDVFHPTVSDAWFERLREAMAVDGLLFYIVERSLEGPSVTSVHCVGSVPGGTAALVRGFVNGRKDLLGAFSPDRTQPRQRNRAVALEPLSALVRLPDAELRRRLSALRVARKALDATVTHFKTNIGPALRRGGLGDMHSVRAVLCDRAGAMLGWIGGFHHAPTSGRPRELLQAVVPALARRLELLATLESAPRISSAMHAALEHIAGAAFLCEPSGRIRQANVRGHEKLSEDPSRVREHIREALSKKSPPAHGDGLRLVVIPENGRGHRSLAANARHWGLTRRQEEVLVLLTRGLSNREIADELGCATHTVELHVSAILGKSKAQTRAELMAALLGTNGRGHNGHNGHGRTPA